MKILGVDPGLTGALALLNIPRSGTGDAALHIESMPVVQAGRARGKDIMENALAAIIRDLAPDVAYVEMVHSMPAQGVVATFTFGLGFGLVRGVLAGLGIRCELVSPQRWGVLVQLPRGDGGSRARAAQLFPREAGQFIPKTAHGRADAALIALAGYRLEAQF